MRAPRDTPPIAITGLGCVRDTPERFLGRRGFKFLSPATRYALAAARLALEDAGLTRAEPYAPEVRGVCMGTNFAVHGVVESMDDVVLSKGALALLAIETPNFSVNLAASYISQRWGFLAFNVTLTDMLVAGLEALGVAARSLWDGRAECALAGAAEGPIPAAAAALLGGMASDGAGCLLVLERLPAAEARGARILARLGSTRQLFIAPEAARSNSAWSVPEARLRRCLDDACVSGGPLRLALGAGESLLVERVNACARDHFGTGSSGPSRREPESVPGTHASAAPLLWLEQALTDQEAVLLVSASPQGHIVLTAFEPVGAAPAARADDELTLDTPLASIPSIRRP